MCTAAQLGTYSPVLLARVWRRVARWWHVGGVANGGHVEQRLVLVSLPQSSSISGISHMQYQHQKIHAPQLDMAGYQATIRTCTRQVLPSARCRVVVCVRRACGVPRRSEISKTHNNGSCHSSISNFLNNHTTFSMISCDSTPARFSLYITYTKPARSPTHPQLRTHTPAPCLCAVASTHVTTHIGAAQVVSHPQV